MNALSIPKGSAVLLGAPAKPMPQSQSLAIGEMVRGIAGAREAYLPQCFVREHIIQFQQMLRAFPEIARNTAIMSAQPFERDYAGSEFYIRSHHLKRSVLSWLRRK